MHSAEPPQLLWLALFCSPPLLIALVFALRSHKLLDTGSIRSGNPLFEPEALPTCQEVVLHPLLHLTRTQGDAGLRALILGLRHMPLKDTAFVLRRYLHSSDPELQLFSQSILQDKQEQLQACLARLLPLSKAESPAILASCIEAGLEVVSSPFTPEPERAAILRKLINPVEAVGASGMTHPRAVFVAARYCLLTRRPEHAENLLARLPEGSPLYDSLTALVRHHAAILRPPPPLTSGYTIH